MCPICGEDSKAVTDKLFPFCSERCQLIDLGRWLDGDYRIAGDPVSSNDSGTDGDGYM